MTFYADKLRGRIDATLKTYLRGYDAAKHGDLAAALVALVDEEARRSFVNGLKTRDRRPRPSHQ